VNDAKLLFVGVLDGLFVMLVDASLRRSYTYPFEYWRQNTYFCSCKKWKDALNSIASQKIILQPFQEQQQVL